MKLIVLTLFVLIHYGSGDVSHLGYNYQIPSHATSIHISKATLLPSQRPPQSPLPPLSQAQLPQQQLQPPQIVTSPPVSGYNYEIPSKPVDKYSPSLTASEVYRPPIFSGKPPQSYAYGSINEYPSSIYLSSVVSKPLPSPNTYIPPSAISGQLPPNNIHHSKPEYIYIPPGPIQAPSQITYILSAPSNVYLPPTQSNHPQTTNVYIPPGPQYLTTQGYETEQWPISF